MIELCFHKHSIKGHEANQKVIKNPGYFRLMERIGDLDMIPDENNFNRNSKLFTFMFVFLAFYTFYWLKFLKYFIKSKQFTSWATAFPNKEDSSRKSFNYQLALKVKSFLYPGNNNYANTSVRESKDATCVSILCERANSHGTTLINRWNSVM